MFFKISLSFSIILVIIIYFVKKKPKEIDNIPRISGLPLAWAILRKKSQYEIQDIIKQQSNDYDIIHTYLGPISNINLISPKYVKDFLMASEDVAPKFETSPDTIIYKFFGEGLPFSNGDTWKTSRKLANPAFNRALSPEMVGETVMDLFAFMKQNLNRPVDVHDIMQRITAEVLGKLAFGYQFGFLESEVPHLINVYKYIMTTLENPFRQAFPWINCLPLESNKRFFDTIDEFDRFIFDIVESKKYHINNNRKYSYDGHVDILTSMLELSKQEGIHLENKQLRDEMITLFSAGHDTTSMALSTSFYYLAKYPEIQEKARAEVIRILGNEPVIPTSDQLKEMKYIGAIIKESLRICPPLVASMPRKLEKPTKIGPYIIPENTLCSVNIWQIHHHPKYWENSEQYNPERFLNNEKRHPFSWIPFSSGPRNCIGQNFSLMEQRIILSMTLLKYHWTLPENSINKDKLLIEAQFLLRPVDLKLVYAERN